MQRVTTAAAEPAAVHAVVAFGVTDGGLDGLAPLEPLALLFVQRLEFAPVDDLHRCAGCVHTAITQVNDRRGGLDADVSQKRVGVLELFGQRVAVVRIAGERPGAPPSALLVRAGQTDFDAEFVRLHGLALADAFDLGRVQRVEFVFAVALLDAIALGALQPHAQRGDAQCVGLLARDKTRRVPLQIRFSPRRASRMRAPSIVRWRLIVRRKRLNCVAWA